MPAVSRSTAAVEATPRFAILGSTIYAATEAAVDVSIDTPRDDKYAFVIVRWVDASNFAYLKLHLSSASDTLWLGVRIAGVETILDSVDSTVSGGTSYTLRVVALASGRLFGSLLTSSGGLTHSLSAQHSALLTGGALDDGKPGFADQSTGTLAAVRTYDRFYAATPPEEPIALYSGRNMEFRYDTTQRQDATGTYAGPPPEYVGSRFFIPPAGGPGREARIAVVARRNDISTGADDFIADSTTVAAYGTSRFLVIPR